MKQNIKSFLAILIGVYVGTGILMLIDAAISVSLIDINDPSTVPNMNPWIRIYFIPVVGSFFAVISLLAELTRNFIWKSKINKLSLWVLLGASYTTVLCFLALVRIVPIEWAYFIMTLSMLIFNPIVIHYRFGRSKKVEV